MKRFTGLFFACGLLVCLGLACEERGMPTEDLSSVTSALTTIPAEYGELEAVTSIPEYPGWFQLWFEDEAGTIRVLRVEIFENLIHQNVNVIERSGTVEQEDAEDEG